ncbi:MAG TPA: hypothetical protein PLB81_05120 [Deltaproteobacteria bacterium]|nr:hypothetical protein [Deltaproteobacteria bacterium]
MKKAGLVSILILPAMLWGCVLSVTPDTSETIVLAPGQTQEFAVRTSGIGGNTRRFYLVDVTDPDVPLSDTIEQNNFSFVIDDDPQTDLDTATYTPNEQSAGKYTILYAADFGTSFTELEMLMQKIMKSTHSRIWQVVVRGVAVTPRQNTAIRPGTALTYTARAYPEGVYTYQWLIDDTIVAMGPSYDFSPTAGQSGLHTLTVKASGEGWTYSLTREISVAVN